MGKSAGENDTTVLSLCSQEANPFSLRVIINPALQLLIPILVILLAQEASVFVLSKFITLSEFGRSLMYPALLALTVAPILYFSMLRPLRENVAELKRVEAALREKEEFLHTIMDTAREQMHAEKALIESEEKYRSLVESTDDSIYVVDGECRFIHMNRKHSARMGFSGSQYAGRKYSEFHSPEQTEKFAAQVSLVIATGESQNNEHQSSRDGRYFAQTLSPVRGAEGTVVAVTVISKDVTPLKEMEARLRTLSLTDELTGLYNRRGYATFCEQMLKVCNRRRKSMYLLYADLDNLKYINDTYGHPEGDHALVDVAEVLKATFRDSDVLARIGGDEFVVVPVNDENDIEKITARLNDNVQNKNLQGGRPYTLSISYGFSYYDPADPCSIHELVAHAEKSMYAQKVKKRMGARNLV
ncbi:MAG: GGDEF domain-containing protein [Nitrospiraceae bacterium]|nr:GGDEF domain-containing protein [Nitrospiraceae bacterium]